VRGGPVGARRKEAAQLVGKPEGNKSGPRELEVEGTRGEGGRRESEHRRISLQGYTLSEWAFSGSASGSGSACALAR